MLKSIFIPTLLVSSISLSTLPLAIATAQDPPAETYQPGFWQPVARVAIDRPIEINLINETGVAVDYSLTDTEMEPVTIESAGTVPLKEIKPPLYIVIYPNSENTDNSEVLLKYVVEVTQDNVVNVKIERTPDGNQSNRTFNLQKTGAIYLY